MVGGLLGRGLHGSFVVEDPDGGYQTVLSQHGTPTAVSDSSITVRSADGFVATYRLTDESVVMTGPEGADSIAEGADVAVTALKTGSSARAVHVVDLSQVKDRFEHHFEGGPLSPRDDDDDDDETPEPSPTATSGASV
jgi:type VI secretion system secreted protein VgrG